MRWIITIKRVLSLDASALEIGDRITAALEGIEDFLHESQTSDRKPRIFISELTVGQLKFKGEIMAFQLKDDGVATATIVAKDARGNPTTVQSPAWSVSDDTLLTVTPSEDGMSADVGAVGPLGTGQVQFSCDADLGDGVRTITGTADVEVIAGDAAVVEISLASK